MKKEIYCQKCGDKYYQDLTPIAGEWIRKIPGILKMSCVCDSCADPLKSGDIVYCISQGQDPAPIEYALDLMAWEKHFITLLMLICLVSCGKAEADNALLFSQDTANYGIVRYENAEAICYEKDGSFSCIRK